MRLRIAALLTLSLAVGLGSCTAIESNRAAAPFLDVNGKEKRTQISASYSLPRRYLSFEVKGNDSTMRGSSRFKIERNAESEYLGPDPSPLFRYEVNYVPSRFAKDEVDFAIEDQILKTVTVSTDDQTGQILINLAKSLSKIARIAQGLDAEVPGAGAAVGEEHLIATLKLDPTDPVSVARTRAILSHDSTHGLDLQVNPPPRALSVIPACDHAVCYRPLVSVTLTFIDKRSGNVTEFVVSVPDPHQITGLDIERSSFVKRDTIFTFDQGTLATVDITKPSELAAAALLPLEIVNAIFAGTNEAISSLLGLQKNELQASTDLLNAQANFLRALQAYRGVETDVLGAPDQPVAGGSDALPGGRAAGDDPVPGAAADDDDFDNPDDDTI